MAKRKVQQLHEIPSIAEIKKHIQERLEKIKKLRAHDKKVEKGLLTPQITSKSKLEDTSKKRQPLHKFEHEFIKSGITGFDSLFENGIPKGSSILVAGGPGSGKTIFCLQTIADAVSKGERCLYLSFEESEERLKQHMEDFGWDWLDMEKKGFLKISRQEPFRLANNIEAMLAKAKGELLIDINDVLEVLPAGFKPGRIVIDSITAIGSAFIGKEEGYRIFIEQLFRYFEEIQATTFIISETEQLPTKYSVTGTEEFLADGVVVLYNLQKGDVRLNALEVLKMRGVTFKKKLVPFRIIAGKGIEVYPDENVFINV